MGVWYTHNQTGSILGTIIPAIFAHHHWWVIRPDGTYLCSSVCVCMCVSVVCVCVCVVCVHMYVYVLCVCACACVCYIHKYHVFCTRVQGVVIHGACSCHDSHNHHYISLPCNW